MKSLALTFLLIGALSASPVPNPCIYTVKHGDTGYQIAANAHITVRDLSALNKKFNDWENLQVGQKLNLCIFHAVPSDPPQPTPQYVAPAPVQKVPTIQPQSACTGEGVNVFVNGKCFPAIDGCSSTGYSSDGSCNSCIANFFPDKGKCSPVVFPHGCTAVDAKAGLNNITQQLSCTACDSDFTLFQDPNNKEFADASKVYQFCLFSSPLFDGEYAPLFGIVDSKYYCATRDSEKKSGKDGDDDKGWDLVILNPCTDMKFKEYSVFAGSFPITAKDGNPIYTFANEILANKGGVTMTYAKFDKEGTNFEILGNQLQYKVKGTTNCAFIDNDHSVYLNPQGDKNSCGRLGMLKKV